jgi:hypothetical protein
MRLSRKRLNNDRDAALWHETQRNPQRRVTAMTYTTTLAAIRSHLPCESGWRRLLAHLDKTAADDEPLPILTVLESNGLDDALRVFDAVAPRHLGDDFLIRRLDTGEYSALKTLRSLPGDWSFQIEAVERVVGLLHRRRAGEDVAEEMGAAAHAAYAVSHAATDAAARAAARVAARAAAHAAAEADLIATLNAA